MSSAGAAPPPLPIGAGYGVVLGLGGFFAVVMIAATWALKRYQSGAQTAESFSTAGRTVKSGLVASSVVSSWTWAATLLQSSAVAYRYGVSGPFWYAAGACVQILLFATLAIEVKRRAPNAHTFLEVIRARYGKMTHLTFIIFGLMTNILVTAMLLTGCGAVASTLTGIPVAAACFLLPIFVVIYTMFGGIKATFLTDWLHSIVVISIILIFAFTAYATNVNLGSPGAVWDALQEAAVAHPVQGNAGGSYLTMRSSEGAIFFVINLVGNFGTVFLDNAYYNKAIAASPVHALPGYVLGGLAWFALPWLCATTMGLSALALETNPVFPTFPSRMSPEDITAGLVLPYAAVALLGQGGAAATLVMVTMAFTSSMGAELIAVSSIFTYDIYKTYVNPKASAQRLLLMSWIACAGFALVMAGFSTGLFYAGVGMGYLYLLMGCMISSAVLPATLTLLWKDQNWIAAGFSPLLGFGCSITTWLVTAQTEFGELTVVSTGSNYPMLAGNVCALLSPAVFIPVLTFTFGKQNYDWTLLKNIRKAGEEAEVSKAALDTEAGRATSQPSIENAEEAAEQAQLKKSAFWARIIAAVAVCSFLILWPWPMYGTAYVFSRKFFTGWVAVGFIWIFCSAGTVSIWPVVQNRKTIAFTVRAAWMDLRGHREKGSVSDGVGSDSADVGPIVKDSN